MYLTFIIPIHNQLDQLQRCVTSILITAGKLGYNIILIDDSSTDPQIQSYCQRLVKYSRHPKFTYLHNPTPRGVTAACNQGITKSPSHTTHYVFINTNIEFGTRDWTSSLKCLSNMSDVGLFGPMSNNAGAQSVPPLQGGGLPKGETVSSFTKVIADLTEHRYPSISFIHEFCYIVKRDVIDDIGYFNEDVFPDHGAKDDLSLRAVNAGWRGVVLDDVFVYRVGLDAVGDVSGPAAVAQRALAAKYGGDYIRKLTMEGQVGLNYLRKAMLSYYQGVYGMPRRIK